jgi:hypothetical protein
MTRKKKFFITGVGCTHRSKAAEWLMRATQALINFIFYFLSNYHIAHVSWQT